METLTNKTEDANETITIFKKFRNGEVIAFFPEEPWNTGFNMCSSYMHIGQHGAADTTLIRTLRTARPEEYKELLEELRDMGYEIKIVKRMNKKFDDKRIANIRDFLNKKPAVNN